MKTHLAVKHFNNLIEAYSAVGDYRRVSSFSRASSAISGAYPVDLPEDLRELLELPGVGNSTVQEVIELKETGTSVRLSNIEEEARLSLESGSNEEWKKASDLVASLMGGISEQDEDPSE